MTVYANPGTEGSIVNYRERYDNFIGGEWVAPVDGEYLAGPGAHQQFRRCPAPRRRRRI